MIAIFDIDGVLADDTHRRHHLDAPKRNWVTYFEGIADDPPIQRNVAFVQCLAARCCVWLWTGRPVSTQAATEDWLQRQGLLGYYTNLQMRPSNNYDPAYRLKRRWAEHAFGRADAAHSEAAERRSALLFLLDDDERIVASYRALGLPGFLYPGNLDPRGSTAPGTAPSRPPADSGGR